MTYTQAHIEQYLQGNMSPAERHAMERAALQDPFLADAIEGFAGEAAQQAGMHLSEIEQMLLAPFAQKEEAPVVAMPRKSRAAWWAAAAVLVSGGLIALSILNSNKNENQFAQNTPVAPQVADSFKPADPHLYKNESATDTILVSKNDVSTSATASSSFGSFETKAADDNAPVSDSISANGTYWATKEKVLPASPGRVAAKPLTVAEDANFIAEEKTDVAKQNYNQNADLAKNNSLYNNHVIVPTDKSVGFDRMETKRYVGPSFTYKIPGTIVNKKGQPIANAIVKASDNSAVVQTDSLGNFVLNTTKDTLSINVNASNYDYANVQLNANTSNKIVLAPSGLTLSEMVVTSMGKKKDAAPKKQQAVDAKPQGGWQSFQEYVNAKLKNKMDTTIDRVSRDVEIEFLVDENGKPYNLKVIQSVDDETDKKAMEILKSGPVWIATPQSKKGKVTIKF